MCFCEYAFLAGYFVDNPGIFAVYVEQIDALCGRKYNVGHRFSGVREGAQLFASSRVRDC